ncbi:MAG: NAD(P)H-dependent oxidoreductase [Gammaproteobacteria bacterium]
MTQTKRIITSLDNNSMKNINYAIISGSTRPQSQSKKVAEFIKQTLLEHTEEALIEIIDLAIDRFPLWDETVWSKGPEWHPNWSAISKKLHKAEAIVIIAPEWGGMVPPQLKNFFQLCSNRELSHKPGLIIGVSSGNSGSYPIAELRMSSFKNTKICYIPDHVIIRDVTNVLNTLELTSNDNDKNIRERMEYALSLLNLYADGFRQIRNHEIIINSKYPYGM